MPSRPTPSISEFRARVREYLPMDATAWASHADGTPPAEVPAGEFQQNLFYLFDAE